MDVLKSCVLKHLSASEGGCAASSHIADGRFSWAFAWRSTSDVVLGCAPATLWGLAAGLPAHVSSCIDAGTGRGRHGAGGKGQGCPVLSPHLTRGPGRRPADPVGTVADRGSTACQPHCQDQV